MGTEISRIGKRMKALTSLWFTRIIAVPMVCLMATAITSSSVGTAQETIDAVADDEQIADMPTDQSPPTDQSATDAAEEEALATDPDGWLIKSPAGANVKFLMPGKTREVERSFSPLKGKPPITTHIYMSTQDNVRTAVPIVA